MSLFYHRESVVAPLPRTSIRTLSVVVLAVGAFVVAFGGPFVSDDTALITAARNGPLQALRHAFWSDETPGIYTNAYRPVVQFVLAVAYRLWGETPAAFHLMNLALHAACSLLVFRLLRCGLRSRAPGEAATGASRPIDEWAAWFGACLFAIHPAHAESVAWISGATDLWMSLLLLLSLELLSRPGRTRVGLSIAAGAMALLAKEPAVVLPGLWAASAWTRGLPGPMLRRGLCATGIGVTVGLAALFGLRPQADLDATLSFNAIPLLMTGRYALIALWPDHLTFQGQPLMPSQQGLLNAPALITIGGVLWAALLGLGILSLRRAQLRGWVGDLAWFMLPLAPVVILLDKIVSDRFLYLPIVGIAALSARTLRWTFDAAQTIWSRTGFALLAVTILVFSLSLSPRAAAAFLGPEQLWRSQITAFPLLPKGYDALGEYYVSKGRYQEARALFERGQINAMKAGQRPAALHFAYHFVQLNAIAPPAWDLEAMALARRTCEALLDQGRAPVSKEYGRSYLLRSEERVRTNDNVRFVLLPCAHALLALQDANAALPLLQRALKLRPKNEEVVQAAALCLARMGRFDAALGVTRKHTAPPWLAERLVAARKTATTSVPDEPHAEALQRARVAMMLGNPVGARGALSTALRIEPADHELIRMLVQSYLVEGRFDDAVRSVERAQLQDPQDPYWAQALIEVRKAVYSSQGGVAVSR